MQQLFNLISTRIVLFLLILVRMSGLFIMSPVFGRKSFPNIFKVGLCFFISVILVEVLPNTDLKIDSLLQLCVICTKEFLVGLILGYITYLFFMTVYMAGQLIDMQIGFGMAELYDSQQYFQAPLLGNLFSIIELLLFFMIDGQDVLIQLMCQTYSLIPVGKITFKAASVPQVFEIFKLSFSLSIRIAIPVIIACLMAEIGIGILGKTVPQMNIFVVGFPVKIFLGLLVIMLLIPGFVSYYKSVLYTMFESFMKVVKALI